MLNRLLVISVSVILSTSTVSAATLSIGGNYRFGTNLYSNLDLSSGEPQGGGNTSTFIENRFLMKPQVVVDDRFTAVSEISLYGVSNSGNLSPENMGSVVGNNSTNTSGAYVRRAWLDWASDWGIFRVGRQPKDWGLGLLYDSGKDPLDDFGTTADRVGFQALLGNLGVNIAYEKANEGLLNRDSDDADTYELSLDYSNPESMLDVGILYTRNVRAVNSGSPFKSSHDLSIFAQKKVKTFQIGGEFVSISQDTYGTSSGFLGQIDYQPGAVKFGADFAWASSSSTATMNFNPNYQPMMILFRQSLGATKPLESVRGGTGGLGFGSAVGEGDGAGGLLVKGRLLYSFDKDRYQLGTDLGWAKLTRQGSNSGSALGVEFDMHLTQKWYENFKTGYGFGILFPGDAFGPAVQTAWGLQIRGALNF